MWNFVKCSKWKKRRFYQLGILCKTSWHRDLRNFSLSSEACCVLFKDSREQYNLHGFVKNFIKMTIVLLYYMKWNQSHLIHLWFTFQASRERAHAHAHTHTNDFSTSCLCNDSEKLEHLRDVWQLRVTRLLKNSFFFQKFLRLRNFLLICIITQWRIFHKWPKVENMTVAHKK